LLVYANKPGRIFLSVYVCIVKMHFFALDSLSQKCYVHAFTCVLEININFALQFSVDLDYIFNYFKRFTVYCRQFVYELLK
jgi:hypothetical protein